MALGNESLYLCPFGSASVSRFINLPGRSRPSRFSACTQINRSPLQTIHFSVKEIDFKWVLNLSLVYFRAI